MTDDLNTRLEQAGSSVRVRRGARMNRVEAVLDGTVLKRGTPAQVATFLRTDGHLDGSYFRLKRETYYCLEANRRYMSNSQYGDWLDCEARAYAEHVTGDYSSEDKSYFVVGRWMHAQILRAPGWEDEIKELEDTKTRKGDDWYYVLRQARGGLSREGRQCDRMLKRWRLETDLHGLVDGESEVILTGTIAGVRWRCAVDSLHVSAGFFTDLKTPRNLDDDWFESHQHGGRVKGPWYEKFNYPRQMAIYRYLIRQHCGEWLDPHILAITKHYEPLVRAFGFDLGELDDRQGWELAQVEDRMPRIVGLREGKIEPVRCERCRYCRMTDVSNGNVVVVPLAGEAL